LSNLRLKDDVGFLINLDLNVGDSSLASITLDSDSRIGRRNLDLRQQFLENFMTERWALRETVGESARRQLHLSVDDNYI